MTKPVSLCSLTLNAFYHNSDFHMAHDLHSFRTYMFYTLCFCLQIKDNCIVLDQPFRPGNGDTPSRATTVQSVEYATPYARRPEEYETPYARRPEEYETPYARRPEEYETPYARRPEENATPYAREPEEKVPLGTTNTTTIANPNPYSKCVKLHLTTKPNLLTLTCMINPSACIQLFACYNTIKISSISPSIKVSFAITKVCLVQQSMPLIQLAAHYKSMRIDLEFLPIASGNSLVASSSSTTKILLFLKALAKVIYKHCILFLETVFFCRRVWHCIQG